MATITVSKAVISITWMIYTQLVFTYAQTGEPAGNACNTTASQCQGDERRLSFLATVLVIACSISAFILLLSIAVCVYHCFRKRTSMVVEIESTPSEFQWEEEPQVHFRRVDGESSNRMAASVFSWGSEFSDGERKGHYENPDVIVGMSRKSRGQIYANTGIISQEDSKADKTYTNVNQYANVHAKE